ncbi:hypothetical protein ACFVFQ_30710 [Streptomyces sp. NPDC057743]|uniref:hypothetical protein n=1 Tax=Streptomyces sp. NPDC057743 TaxID=3346236 RepID=UPI003686C706
MKLARRIIATGAAVAACAAAVVATTTSSHASDPGPSVSVADGQFDSAVEDFTYPGADKIEKEKGITLKRGDGHIVLADCSSGTGLMEVWSRKNEKICFRTTGASGYLALEIPSVHIIKGSSDHSADVTLATPKAKPQEVEVSKGQWTPVGESVDPEGREYVLVEIRTNK